MRKSSRPKLPGVFEAQSHNHTGALSPDSASEQLRDGDVPTPSPDTKDYAHRSLYARPETLELIRELAFKERTSAQALYREGLFLMLRERGEFLDKTKDDV